MGRWCAMRLIRRARLILVVAAIGLFSLSGRAGEEREVKVKVPPAYPEMARRLQISGVVKIEATVDANGGVTDVKTVSGNHLLAIAAEEAVRKWKFVPGPSKSTVNVDVSFVAPK